LLDLVGGYFPSRLSEELSMSLLRFGPLLVHLVHQSFREEVAFLVHLVHQVHQSFREEEVEVVQNQSEEELLAP